MDEIEFRDLESGRTAYLAAWDIPVWRILANFKAARGDLWKTSRQLCLPVDAVRSALHYAAGHAREIRNAMQECLGGIDGAGPRAPLELTVADQLGASAETKHS
jgi:hypothetical protein